MGTTWTVFTVPDEIVYMITTRLNLIGLMAACGTCRSIRKKIISCPYRLFPDIPFEYLAAFRNADGKGEDMKWFTNFCLNGQWHPNILAAPSASDFVRITDDFVKLFKCPPTILVSVQANTPFSIKKCLPRENNRRVDQRDLMCEVGVHLGDSWAWNLKPKSTDDLFYHPKVNISSTYTKRWENFVLAEGGLPTSVEALWLALKDETRKRVFTINGSRSLLRVTEEYKKGSITFECFLDAIDKHLNTKVTLPCAFFDEYEYRRDRFQDIPYDCPRLATTLLYDGLMFPHSKNLRISYPIKWEDIVKNICTRTLRFYWLGITLKKHPKKDIKSRNEPEYAYSTTFDTYEHLNMKDLAASLTRDHAQKLQVVFVLSLKRRQKLYEQFNEMRERVDSYDDLAKVIQKPISDFQEALLPTQVHSTCYWKEKWEKEVFCPIRQKGIEVEINYEL